MARALWELDFNTTHVGGLGQPPRGSSDEAVLQHARLHKQTVVTSNLDFVELCCDEGASVVWVDPRGRQMNRLEMARRIFDHMDAIEEALQSGPVCVRVLRTKTERLTLDRARGLVVQRQRVLKRRKRQKQAKPLGGLLD